MLYREYGDTGKKVSVIGFGGMRLKKEENDEKTIQILIEANNRGINYFDTAHDYCGGKGEEIMGLAFKHMSNPFYISTKSMIQHDPDESAVRKRIDASLKKLNVEKINFFHMWCILSMEQYARVMAPGGPYDGAMRAKEEGLIEHISISTHLDGEDIEKIAEDGFYDGITLGYNILNYSYRLSGLSAAFKKSMGIAVMNPLAGGIISQFSEKFEFLKENEDETVAQAAIRFVASRAEVSSVLCGMRSIEEVIENTQVSQKLSQMSVDTIHKIKNIVKEKLEDFCTGCGYCKGCPANIPIPKYLDVYNRYILSGKKEEIPILLRGYWGMSKKMAGECIGCGACEKKCTQKLPIIYRLGVISGKTIREKQ